MKRGNSEGKFIIIIGCGRLGAYLASTLSESKQNSVVVIDKKEEAFDRLGSSYSGFTIVADASEIETLRNAKIMNADVLVATTNHDNTNIMIAQIAKSFFNVPRVIARLTEPAKEKVYAELGIDTISPTALSSMEFYRIIMENGD